MRLSPSQSADARFVAADAGIVVYGGARACFGRNPLPSGYPASRGPRDNCSIDKIVQFAAELKDPETSPGVGSGNSISSSWRSPVKTTPRIWSSSAVAADILVAAMLA